MSSSKANETAASSLDWLTGGAAGAAGCSGHGVMSKDLSRCICDLSYFGTKCELVEPVKGTAIRKMKQIPYHFFPTIISDFASVAGKPTVLIVTEGFGALNGNHEHAFKFENMAKILVAANYDVTVLFAGFSANDASWAQVSSFYQSQDIHVVRYKE